MLNFSHILLAAAMLTFCSCRQESGQDGGPWRIKKTELSRAAPSGSGEITFSMIFGGGSPQFLAIELDFKTTPSPEQLRGFSVLEFGRAAGELYSGGTTKDGATMLFFHRLSTGWPLKKEFTLSGMGHQQGFRTPRK